MDNQYLQKQKDIQKKLLIAIGLAALAIIFTIFRLPFDFLLALAAYIVAAVAVIKKDGALGILQVVLVFPAIFKGISGFFDGDDGAVSDTGNEKPQKLERLANFTLFFTAVTILITIFYPIFRFIWNLFT